MLVLYCRLLVEQLTHAEREYVRQAEEKVMALELAKTPDGVDGVLVLGGGRDNNENRTAVVPTTEELTRYIHNPSTMQEIQKLRSQAMQQSEEKVAIAKQAYSLVDSTVRRLDHDLAALEKYAHSFFLVGAICYSTVHASTLAQTHMQKLLVTVLLCLLVC